MSDARSRSAWYTPPEAADEVVKVAEALVPIKYWSSWDICEPSAGNGALIDAMTRAGADSRTITAIEIDAAASNELAAKSFFPAHVSVFNEDYLRALQHVGVYDLTIMNPPTEGGLDSQFVSKAMDESLRVVALVRLTLLESARSHDRIWSRVATPEFPDRDWNLSVLRIFTKRPSFLLAGDTTGGGKTAFAIIGLEHRAVCSRADTSVSWVKP